MALENKLDITDSAELARVEERLSKARALELFFDGLLDVYETGTFRGLAQIHRYLFGELYGFAGKVRTEDLARDGGRYAPAVHLRDVLHQIDGMPQSTLDEIVEKYVAMNAAHPFQEGNGRSMRFWLNAMLNKELGRVVDWSQVDKEAYLLAMERSPVQDLELKALLREALTSRTHDQEVYRKGVDASYAYAGCCACKA